MIRKMIPILLPVLALVGGAFAGDMLRSPASPADGHPTPAGHAEDKGHSDEGHSDKSHEEPAHEPAADKEHGSAHGEEADKGHADAAADGHGSSDHAAPNETAFFTFPSQFFVPLVRQGDMRSMMILTLTLQTNGASRDALYKKEHALRDAMLRQLMIYANTGGFDGNYTADRKLAVLREQLLTAVKGVTELPVEAVLIEDIAMQ
ncbi:MAG: hypothetical protein FJX25_10760 [Alphaproteobacteria bacterium]|nr:hypothetical protein [Alphaproteobacteria bacterium]